jgi:hypothetical protein
VIILGGMLAGIYTATEGGGIAVAYAVFLSVVVFRAMTLKGFGAFLRAARTSASIYLLVAAATILSYALNILGISSWVSTAASHFEDKPRPVPLRHRRADAGARHLPRHRRGHPDLRAAHHAGRYGNSASTRCRSAWSSC